MEIKLLSYNLQSWEITDRRIAGIFDIIKKNDPDIICFQEVTIFWYSVLRKKFGYKYVITGRDRFYGNKERAKRYFERNCVAYKKDRFSAIKCRTYWLGPDVLNPSKYEEAGLNRIFTTAYLKDKITNKKIQVISTHLDDRLPHIRAKQGEILSKYTSKQTTPLLLAGDFNSVPTEGAYQTIKNVLVDVGEEMANNEFTYHGYENGNAMRIDFVFRNNQVKSTSFKLIKDKYEGLPPSDHYPLLCLFKI
jgi:endonuclease/exonuclease/phosphatase family metal-dependent hydrolase